MYKLSPSKAHRYLQCTASLKHELPFSESPASIRGSQLHEVAEKLLTTLGTEEELFEEYSLNDYERFLISSYVSSVLQEYEKIKGKDLLIEEKINVDICQHNLNMILDTLVVARKSASVIDLKTGNVDVDVENNSQLLFYGYGVITKYPKIKEFNLSIFQKGKKKTITVTKKEILDFFIDKASIFEKIKNNDLEYSPSEKACKYCDYKNQCQVRAKWVLEEKYGQ